jgi:hypothetical protein
MNFVQLQSFSNYIDAHVVKGQLEEAGILCWLKDENSMTITPFLSNALGGIKLMVPEDDMESAKEILASNTSD